MGMAAPHCIAFVNPKCANDAKLKRVRIAHVLNGKQNSAVYIYGAAAQWGTTCSKGGPDTATTNSLEGPLVLP